MKNESKSRQRLIKRLKGSWITSLQWATETGSVKLSTRCSELRSEGISVVDRWLTLPSGKKIKQYRIQK